jgi:hypothetical protein
MDAASILVHRQMGMSAFCMSTPHCQNHWVFGGKTRNMWQSLACNALKITYCCIKLHLCMYGRYQHEYVEVFGVPARCMCSCLSFLYIHIHIHTYIPLHSWSKVYLKQGVCLNYAVLNTHTHTDTHADTHARTHTRTGTGTHTHTHTHTHTRRKRTYITKRCAKMYRRRQGKDTCLCLM